MQYFHDFDTLQLENTVVACGKFDGIHAGHRKLLEQLFFYQEKGFKSTIFTFDASISKVMQGTKGFIYTSEERCFCLEQLGIDYLVIQTVFDMDDYLAAISVRPVAYSRSYTVYKMER